MILHQHDIQTYLRCQKKFEYAFVRGWERESHSEVIKRGAWIHYLLALFYGGGIQPAVAPPERVNEDEELWYRESITVSDRYWEEQGVRDCAEHEILAVEQEFRLEMDGATILFRPDLVMRSKTDGQLYIVDHKTTSAFPANQRPEYDMDVQHLTYSLAWWKLHGEIPVFLYNLIKRTIPKQEKTRFKDRWRLHRSESELINWENELVVILGKMIERSQISPEIDPHSSTRSIIHVGGEGCATCPYMSVCMAELLQGRTIGNDMMRMMGYKRREDHSDAGSEVQEWT